MKYHHSAGHYPVFGVMEFFSVDSLSSFNLRSAIDGWCAITKHHHDTTACATGVQAKYMTRYGYEHVHGMQETGAT